MVASRTNAPALSFDAVVETPIPGVRLGLRMRGEAVTGIVFLGAEAALRPPRSVFARRAVQALDAYFADPRAPVAVPYLERGTAFQRRVWAGLRAIPAGVTRCYSDLAADLRSAPRAVGGACRANPLPLLTPCHRLVAATGLGGFMGTTSGSPCEIKAWLIHHEKNGAGAGTGVD
ncbi:MAG TPA: methylated-DNA--[protein]-cysteine S-methyltransferase [Gammaproteobacteria bacterium]|nr:methylated-DNA--[protein]-cysteine S-methyltransferase [Gammaproteobacteria bacterium]